MLDIVNTTELNTENATNTTALYTYQNRTSTSVRVTLKLTDASGTGLSDTITYDMPPIVLNRTD